MFSFTYSCWRKPSLCHALRYNRILIRHTSTSPPHGRPGPPPLSVKEQKEWEELIRRNQLPAAPGFVSRTEKEAESQLHPDARRPIKPDFEGETNPATGEIGGPKKEPLQWGAAGEWTYGGRATDF
ncbi:hypothetical protein K439DRAFT_1626617 [Ramaria rubella]|nr:hypothetical protein K439DRAFT_1626617 [Ramaria rubella]